MDRTLKDLLKQLKGLTPEVLEDLTLEEIEELDSIMDKSGKNTKNMDKLKRIQEQIKEVKKDIEEQSENGGSAVDLLWDLQMGLPNLEKKEARLEKKLGIKHETPEKESGSKKEEKTVKEAKTVKINKLTADSEEELKVMLGYAAKYLTFAENLKESVLEKFKTGDNEAADILLRNEKLVEQQGKVLALTTLKEYADLLFDDEEERKLILKGQIKDIPELSDLTLSIAKSMGPIDLNTIEEEKRNYYEEKIESIVIDKISEANERTINDKIEVATKKQTETINGIVDSVKNQLQDALDEKKFAFLMSHGIDVNYACETNNLIKIKTGDLEIPNEKKHHDYGVRIDEVLEKDDDLKLKKSIIGNEMCKLFTDYNKVLSTKLSEADESFTLKKITDCVEEIAENKLTQLDEKSDCKDDLNYKVIDKVFKTMGDKEFSSYLNYKYNLLRTKEAYEEQGVILVEDKRDNGHLYLSQEDLDADIKNDSISNEVEINNFVPTKIEEINRMITMDRRYTFTDEQLKDMPVKERLKAKKTQRDYFKYLQRNGVTREKYVTIMNSAHAKANEYTHALYILNDMSKLDAIQEIIDNVNSESLQDEKFVKTLKEIGQTKDDKEITLTRSKLELKTNLKRNKDQAFDGISVSNVPQIISKNAINDLVSENGEYEEKQVQEHIVDEKGNERDIFYQGLVRKDDNSVQLESMDVMIVDDYFVEGLVVEASEKIKETQAEIDKIRELYDYRKEVDDGIFLNAKDELRMEFGIESETSFGAEAGAEAPEAGQDAGEDLGL